MNQNEWTEPFFSVSEQIELQQKADERDRLLEEFMNYIETSPKKIRFTQEELMEMNKPLCL